MAGILRGKRLEDAMEALLGAAANGDPNGIRPLVVKALRSGSGLLVRQAVRVAADFHLHDLREDLQRAFTQLMAQPAADPGCVAKEAIARVLFQEEDVPDALWLAAVRHVQIEPSFGGSIDTAGELRGIAAMGVAGGSAPQKVHVLIDLLLDAEAAARGGAIQALGSLGSDEALSLVRLRALIPRTDSGTVAECFRALLRPDNITVESIRFVSSFLRRGDGELAEECALALGESRDLRVLPALTDALDTAMHPALRGVLLRSIALLRQQEAFAFLTEWLEDATPRAREEARSALEPFRNEVELADLFRQVD